MANWEQTSMNSSRCDWDNNFNQLLEVSAITAYELSYIIHKLTRTDDTQFCLNLEVYMCMLDIYIHLIWFFNL